jgi:hypothetical protein
MRMLRVHRRGTARNRWPGGENRPPTCTRRRATFRANVLLFRQRDLSSRSGERCAGRRIDAADMRSLFTREPGRRSSLRPHEEETGCHNCRAQTFICSREMLLIRDGCVGSPRTLPRGSARRQRLRNRDRHHQAWPRLLLEALAQRLVERDVSGSVESMSISRSSCWRAGCLKSQNSLRRVRRRR